MYGYLKDSSLISRCRLLSVSIIVGYLIYDTFHSDDLTLPMWIVLINDLKHAPHTAPKFKLTGLLGSIMLFFKSFFLSKHSRYVLFWNSNDVITYHKHVCKPTPLALYVIISPVCLSQMKLKKIHFGGKNGLDFFHRFNHESKSLMMMIWYLQYSAKFISALRKGNTMDSFIWTYFALEFKIE